MSAQNIPFFHAVQNGYLYRAYVTTSDLVCVRLGKGPMPTTSGSRMAIGVNWVAFFCVTFAFLIGAVAGAFIGASIFGTFGGRGPGATIFGYVTGGAIGALTGAGAGWSAAYLIGNVMNPNAAPDEMAKFEKEVGQTDVFLSKCDAAEIRTYISEKKCGYALERKKLTGARIDYIAKWRRMFLGKPPVALILKGSKAPLVFRKRIDAVVAIYEFQRLLDDKLDLALDMDEYENAVKKYAKTRKS